jgi:hypothetical protein
MLAIKVNQPSALFVVHPPKPFPEAPNAAVTRMLFSRPPSSMQLAPQ